MDPEIDEVGRSDYKTGVGYVEGLNWRCGRIDLGLMILQILHEI
jgi:hypothetical protein